MGSPALKRRPGPNSGLNRIRNGPRRAPTSLAVLYARVSSKEQELGYSIAAQQDLLRRYATELNLRITEFSDVESAKTIGRPGFTAMLSWLRAELSSSDETVKTARVAERRRLETESSRLQARLDALYEDRARSANRYIYVRRKIG
jgi:DNA invertase Pin-like site-specific DNA recombinase